MSRHKEILSGVVRGIRETDPHCGVVLFGSVAKGTERPESDLDLFVIASEFREIQFADSKVINEEDGMRLTRGHVRGITVDLACWPVDAFERSFAAKPYLFYPFSLGKTLHDPKGLARHCQQKVRDYFEQNPAIAAAWGRQLAEYERHRLDPSYDLEFPEWGSFVEHLGGMIGGEHE